jgi:hypothetical protein
MAKFLCCRICLVEMERVKLADGSVVVVCGACDVIGVEREVARGGPVWVASMGLGGARRAGSRSNPDQG